MVEGVGWGVKTVGIQREGRMEEAEKTKERQDNRDRGEWEERGGGAEL